MRRLRQRTGIEFRFHDLRRTAASHMTGIGHLPARRWQDPESCRARHNGRVRPALVRHGQGGCSPEMGSAASKHPRERSKAALRESCRAGHRKGGSLVAAALRRWSEMVHVPDGI
jgi:hypothetical protein